MRERKKDIMKKILPYILIPLIIATILAPLTFGINGNKNVVVSKSVALADDNVDTIKILETTKSYVKVDGVGIVVPTGVKAFDLLLSDINQKAGESFDLFSSKTLTGKDGIFPHLFAGMQPSTMYRITLLMHDGDTISRGKILKTLTITFSTYDKDNKPVTKTQGDDTLFSTKVTGTSITIDAQIKDDPTVKTYLIQMTSADMAKPISFQAQFIHGTTNGLFPKEFKDLTPATVYSFSLSALHTDSSIKVVANYNVSTNNTDGSPGVNDADLNGGSGTKVNASNTYDPPNFQCGIGLFESKASISGCFAGIFYTIFRLTAWIFAGAGQFFDFCFGYSIQSSTYQISFITEGWAVIRDFVNMFFIFVLLYAAISIILDLGHGDGKKIIVNVIIIGLLINFSLFATQVLVDTSNILARVFYNSIIIKGGKDTGNKSDNTAGAGNINAVDANYKSLSAALVEKINPQRLIESASKVQTETASKEEKIGDIGVGSFILVTCLAIVVNIVGLFVFLSAGLIFLARIIGLALAMIFSPLAFFSYTVPKMRSIKTVGMDKWLPDTLKMAFLAPVFIFFIYLIIQFVQTGLGLSGLADPNVGNTKLVLLIMIPFAFIIVLLKKAGSIAQEMSGEIGEAITKGLKVAGGVALGATALSGAFLGRKVIGGTLAAAARTDQSKFTGTQRVKYNEKLEKWEKDKKAGVAVGPKPTWKEHLNSSLTEIDGRKYYENEKGEVKEHNRFNPISFIGGRLNAAQYKTDNVDHSRHIIDEVTDKRYKDKKYTELSGQQQKNVKADYIKQEGGKFADAADNEYRTRNGLSKQANLNSTQREGVKQIKEGMATAEFESKVKEAAQSVGLLTRAFAKANTGSWDVRNLSQMKSDKREGFLSKVSVALIAGVAGGVRMGLKQGIQVEHGTGQKDFGKDLGNVIKDALKGMKIEAPKNMGGESHDHGGGGHGASHAPAH